MSRKATIIWRLKNTDVNLLFKMTLHVPSEVIEIYKKKITVPIYLPFIY